MTPEQFDSALRQIMDEVAVMTLATCAAGSPWASDVYFAADGFDLVFFSSPSSRHCRNLAANPACAGTIHPQARSWREIKGLQMEGIAEPLSSMGGKARGLAAYLRKFPFARELLIAPTASARAFNKATLHVFRPSRILYLDNSLSVGVRHCVRLKDGRMDGLSVLERNA
jgi:uncharacterized protein YhbP (UPF0306 family)